MRPEDHALYDLICDSGAERIAMCAVGHKRKELIESLIKMGLDIDVYDYHPYLDCEHYKQVDVIFDDVDLSEYDLIVNCAAEKMWPIGKVHRGEFIIVHNNTVHNGHCTHYKGDVFEAIVEDNKLVELDRTLVEGRYFVYGVSE